MSFLLFISTLHEVITVSLNISSVALIFCSLVWTVHIISEIKRLYPLWKYQTLLHSKEAVSTAKNYKDNLIKFIIALIFAITELATFSLEIVQGITRASATTPLKNTPLNSTNNGTDSYCTLRVNTVLWWNKNYPLVFLTESLRQVGMIILPVLLIVLTLHIQSIYSKTSMRKTIQRFIIVTIAIIFLFIFTRLFPATFLISEVIYAVSLPALFIPLIRRTQELYRSLKQRKDDLFHAETELQWLYIRERKQIVLFKRTTISIYITATIGIVGQVLYIVINACLGSIVLNPCWFNSLYNNLLHISHFSSSTVSLVSTLTAVGNSIYLLTGSIFLFTVVIVNLSVFFSILSGRYKIRMIYDTAKSSLFQQLLQK